MIVPVLLSGGSGSRLWPVSRKSYPKQFIPLLENGLSSLQATWERLSGLNLAFSPIIVGQAAHRFIIGEQLRAVHCSEFQMIAEPVGRNTAAAAAIAAQVMLDRGEDAILLVLPADHIIRQPEVFCEAVRMTKPQAAAGKLVVFGITPQTPHTGYGYIHGQSSAQSPTNPHKVDAFIEKPDLERAQAYLNSGDYYWNSGMFMFQASAFLQELKTYAPDVYSASQKAFLASRNTDGFLDLDEQTFSRIPDISIDYAVMEHTENAVVHPISCGWDDIGSWTSLSANARHDEQGNALEGEALAIDCRNTYIHSDHRLTTAVGVDDLVIVETRDAVMVTPKSTSQKVKSLVATLKSLDRPEATEHTRGYRPWGYYDSLEIAEGFQVKRIVVNPGHQLSLQMHQHRSEHWIVLSGVAEVTLGETTFLLNTNESIFIPVGTKHRLANSTSESLEIIEVQVGSYLGEDDIIRFDDVYGRTRAIEQ